MMMNDELQGGDQKQRLHLSLPARLVAIFVKKFDADMVYLIFSDLVR